MENLEKLTAFLEKSGTGFITGNYQSFYGLEDIRNRLKTKLKYTNPKTRELMYINLSFNNEPIGEFLVHISNIKNKKVLCEVCKNVCDVCNDVDYYYPIIGYGDKILITLSPFNGTDDDIGTFLARGPWGNPRGYEAK
jgi:hypothetical protein